MGIVGGRRRTVGRMVMAACVGSLLLGAAGCTAPSPSEPAPTSNPPTVAPVFASDEEALAAATEAYSNYLATYDALWADGDGAMDDYLALSTGNAHDGEVQSMTEWEAKGWRATGTTAFDSMALQSISRSDTGGWTLRTYLCVDASQGEVIDGTGASVAKPDRPLRLPLEVEFTTTSATSDQLLISESKVWSGKDFC